MHAVAKRWRGSSARCERAGDVIGGLGGLICYRSATYREPGTPIWRANAPIQGGDTPISGRSTPIWWPAHPNFFGRPPTLPDEHPRSGGLHLLWARGRHAGVGLLHAGGAYPAGLPGCRYGQARREIRWRYPRVRASLAGGCVSWALEIEGKHGYGQVGRRGYERSLPNGRVGVAKKMTRRKKRRNRRGGGPREKAKGGLGCHRGPGQGRWQRSQSVKKLRRICGF